jgi:hypothetical protein
MRAGLDLLLLGLPFEADFNLWSPIMLIGRENTHDFGSRGVALSACVLGSGVSSALRLTVQQSRAWVGPPSYTRFSSDLEPDEYR